MYSNWWWSCLENQTLSSDNDKENNNCSKPVKYFDHNLELNWSMLFGPIASSVFPVVILVAVIFLTGKPRRVLPLVLSPGKDVWWFALCLFFIYEKKTYGETSSWKESKVEYKRNKKITYETGKFAPFLSSSWSPRGQCSQNSHSIFSPNRWGNATSEVSEVQSFRTHLEPHRQGRPRLTFGPRDTTAEVKECAVKIQWSHSWTVTPKSPWHLTFSGPLGELLLRAATFCSASFCMPGTQKDHISSGTAARLFFLNYYRHDRQFYVEHVIPDRKSFQKVFLDFTIK